MNLIELNNKLKMAEVDKSQFEFHFPNEFIPEKFYVSGIRFKENNIGDIVLNLMIEGHIKGFPEFKVKTFRAKKIFDNFKDQISFLEFKTPLKEMFNQEELIDLEKKGIIDLSKNLFFIDKIEIFDNDLKKEIEQRSIDEQIDFFLNKNIQYLKDKIDYKVLKTLQNSKPKSEINIPDELKDYITPNGTLKEERKSLKSTITKKPLLDLKIRKFSNIPSINSVVKKVNEGKKLNFVETILYEKLNRYLSYDYEKLLLFTKNYEQSMLKNLYQRELARHILSNEIDKIKDKIEKPVRIEIDGHSIDTKMVVEVNDEIKEKEIKKENKDEIMP